MQVTQNKKFSWFKNTGRLLLHLSFANPDICIVHVSVRFCLYLFGSQNSAQYRSCTAGYTVQKVSMNVKTRTIRLHIFRSSNFQLSQSQVEAYSGGGRGTCCHQDALL